MNHSVDNPLVDRIALQTGSGAVNDPVVGFLCAADVAGNALEEVERFSVRWADQLIVFIELSKRSCDIVSVSDRFAVMPPILIGIEHVALLKKESSGRVCLVKDVV